MHVAIVAWVLFSVWRWGDWKHWREYHATMLYISLCDILYYYFVETEHLWHYKGDSFISYRAADLLHAFITLPGAALLFLSNFPASLPKQILHVLKWTAIFVSVEWIAGLAGMISYKHDWSLMWSIPFNLVMFPMLRIHHQKPLLAYALSAMIILLLLNIFDAWQR